VWVGAVLYSVASELGAAQEREGERVSSVGGWWSW